MEHLTLNKPLNKTKVITVGGGTGLSTMLRGIKRYTTDITAIVTVADDGGGSGRLREDLGILPPGDIRNCILALANTEPIMEKLLQYRFEEGELKGQNFGNLFLAAMNGICNSFEEAVRNMSSVLAVKGKVLPVTLEDIKLCAKLTNSMVIEGESRIPEFVKTYNSKIDKVYLCPQNPLPNEECLYEIQFADIIVLGPGSLYTSIIPNLLVDGISDAIRKSSAIKIYVCNVMTQPGETEDYSLNDHIEAIKSHCGENLIDYVIVNNIILDENTKEKYTKDGAAQVLPEPLQDKNIKVITSGLLQLNENLIRHNPKALADCIFDIYYNRANELYYNEDNDSDCKIYTKSKIQANDLTQ